MRNSNNNNNLNKQEHTKQAMNLYNKPVNNIFASNNTSANTQQRSNYFSNGQNSGGNIWTNNSGNSNNTNSTNNIFLNRSTNNNYGYGNNNNMNSNLNKMGTYRATNYIYEKPPANKLHKLWSDTNFPISIMAHEAYQNMSTVEMRIQDYYLIRTGNLDNNHKTLLQDAIDKGKFNRALLNNSRGMVTPVTAMNQNSYNMNNTPWQNNSNTINSNTHNPSNVGTYNSNYNSNNPFDRNSGNTNNIFSNSNNTGGYNNPTNTNNIFANNNNNNNNNSMNTSRILRSQTTPYGNYNNNSNNNSSNNIFSNSNNNIFSNSGNNNLNTSMYGNNSNNSNNAFRNNNNIFANNNSGNSLYGNSNNNILNNSNSNSNNGYTSNNLFANNNNTNNGNYNIFASNNNRNLANNNNIFSNNQQQSGNIFSNSNQNGGFMMGFNNNGANNANNMMPFMQPLIQFFPVPQKIYNQYIKGTGIGGQGNKVGNSSHTNYLSKQLQIEKQLNIRPSSPVYFEERKRKTKSPQYVNIHIIKDNKKKNVQIFRDEDVENQQSTTFRKKFQQNHNHEMQQKVIVQVIATIIDKENAKSESQFQLSVSKTISKGEFSNLVKEYIIRQQILATTGNLSVEVKELNIRYPPYVAVVEVLDRLINLPTGYFFTVASINGTKVTDLTIGNQWGKIIWKGITNIKGIDFSDIIKINENTIDVYENRQLPQIGQQLNKECIVIFNTCILANRLRQKDGSLNKDKLINALRKGCQSRNSQFLNYDEVNDIWSLRIKHF